MPTINTEPELNTEFTFDLGNNSSSRAFFCCRRKEKDSYEEIGSKNLLAAIKSSKCRIDCDEVNTLYDPPKGHSYFRSGKKKGGPGVVFDHIFASVLTGRVFPSDEFRKSSILALPRSK
jgi:hypothetical protein